METLQDVVASYPLLTPALGGGLVHIICHHRPPASLKAFTLVLFLVPTILTLLSHLPPWIFFRTLAVYLISLGLSIASYRLSPFHPLARYPGPLLARVSRLWATKQVIGGQQHVVSHELFARYGDVVRTGPNHLIMRDVRAIPVVHGSKDHWPRHTRSRVMMPLHARGNIASIVDPAEHSQRRRLWDRAFTPSAIKSYEPMLQARLAQLLTNLQARTGQPIDLAQWFGWFSLDFMGDFAFGGMFEFMASGKDVDGLHAKLMRFAHIFETAGTVPWVRSVINALPKGKVRGMQLMARGVAEKRQSNGSQVRDLFHYILNEDGDPDQSEVALTETDIAMEASIAIGAGSDTTATTLSNAIFYLLCHPDVFVRLRAELDAAAGEGASFDQLIDPERLPELKYLQAVINETLRLQPAVPNGTHRNAPNTQDYHVVADHVIPSGTTVQMPIWSIHRDPRYFAPEPETFWPERWLPQEGPKMAEARGQDFKLNKGAYMPFHYGHTNCVGRPLALHEANTVLAAVVRAFDFAFAPGFTPKDWEDQLYDSFILIRGQLKVVLIPRSNSQA